MRIPKGLWTLIPAFVVLLAACQPTATLATTTTSPVTAATAKASDPGTSANPIVLRQILPGAKPVGVSADGIGMSTKTKVYVDTVFMPRFDIAAFLKMAAEFAPDLGVALSQVGNSLTLANGQQTVTEYWLLPWDVLAEAATRTGAISKPVPVVAGLVDMRVSVSTTECQDGANDVVMMIDLSFRGKWYPAPDSDMRMHSTPCVEKLDQSILEDFIMLVRQEWGAFSHFVESAINDIIAGLP